MSVDRGVIQGYVTDYQSGVSLEGVLVNGKQVDGDLEVNAYTESNGYYSLPYLIFGTYDVTVSYNGYVTESVTVTISIDADIANVDFALRQVSKVTVNIETIAAGGVMAVIGYGVWGIKGALTLGLGGILIGELFLKKT